MTYLVERLADLRRHLDHLIELRARGVTVAAMRSDLSLSDALYSLLSLCQLLIDLAGELAARDGLRFETYAEVLAALGGRRDFPPGLADELVPLASFRKVLLHEYVVVDLQRAIDALADLKRIERFVGYVRAIEAGVRAARRRKSNRPAAATSPASSTRPTRFTVGISSTVQRTRG